MTKAECISFLKEKVVNPSWVGTNFRDFPFEWICKQTAEEDCADTDLYQCVASEGGVEIRVAVEVNPITNIIVSIETHDCDIIVGDKIYDSIDLMDKDMVEKVISKIVR